MSKRILKGPTEAEKTSALNEARKSFKILSGRVGFTLASWSYRKVLETNSKQKQLLKRKEELEKELKEINQQV